MNGYVYFVTDVDDAGPIKIGYTTRSVAARIIDLQPGSPVRLKEVYSFRASPHVERSLHETCAAYRLHNEWFERSKCILQCIDEARKGNMAILEDRTKGAFYEEDEEVA